MTPRQFEEGFSTDYHAIQSFLERHGYCLRQSVGRCQIKKPGSRKWSKNMHWTKVLDLVDDIRAAQGLTTIKVRAA